MATVALAAAMLSYQSLAHLGVLCGYGSLAWLYPLVVDAGAAASCAAWLHTRGRQPLAMTWALLAVSVVLNGTTHYLESTGTAPSWLLVVAVAAVPPTVLGLCVHLAVDMSRPGQKTEVEVAGPAASGGIGGKEGFPQARDVQTRTDRPGRKMEGGVPAGSTDPRGLGAVAEGTPRPHARPAPSSHMVRPGQLDPGGTGLAGPTAPGCLRVDTTFTEPSRAESRSDSGDRVSDLIEAGAGRRRIAAELGMSEHAARKLLAERNGEVTR